MSDTIHTVPARVARIGSTYRGYPFSRNEQVAAIKRLALISRPSSTSNPVGSPAIRTAPSHSHGPSWFLEGANI